LLYKNELQFLCDTLKKGHIRTVITSPDASVYAIPGSEGISPSGSEPRLDFLAHTRPEPRTLYRYTNEFDLCYLYLLLPDTPTPEVLIIGPYLTGTPSGERLMELAERGSITPAIKIYFEEYYMSLPVLADDDHLFLMITTFCERIWKSPAFAIVDVNDLSVPEEDAVSEPINSEAFDDVLINMKAMEERYAYENELLRAVSLGQLHKENQLLSVFSDPVFEKRLPDPLRNAKNYGIIMNTLLRKAAENGGVHPVYLDRTSSEFAAKIEHMRELGENYTLMRDMFRSYCRLVRKHALKHYSLVVQQTVMLIDSDLSADLSLQSLSDTLNVSPGYLSTIFKKDTGKTISEYIREKRIQLAMYLLATTQQQVQAIAVHCGIMDVQYFSKTFKKQTGKTPKEYRESLKTSQTL